MIFRGRFISLRLLRMFTFSFNFRHNYIGFIMAGCYQISQVQIFIQILDATRATNKLPIIIPILYLLKIILTSYTS